MKDYIQELSSTSTEIGSSSDSLLPNNESQEILPASAPSPSSQLGVFEVGAEGEVEIDFLFDGGAYLGEVGIFSLEGMSMDSEGFAIEAANRALNNSQESGYIAISDLTDSAMISGSTPYDKNHNIGKYKIEHSFLMASGTQFGIVFAANSSIQDVITNPNGELIFSLPQVNINQSIQFAQVPGVDSTGLTFTNSDTFAFEDIAGIGSDNDFNDTIIQIKGATGTATQLDEVINPERDWRDFEPGRQVLELVGRQKKDEPPIVVNPPVIIEPPNEEPPISIEPPPSEGGGGNDPGDGETGGSNPGGDGGNEEEPVPIPLPPVIIEDKAGDTLAEASSVLPSTAGKSFEDFISINDKDYYSFTVGSGDKITISVDSLAEDIALELKDSEGSMIDFSRGENGETVIIEDTVEGGRYSLIVTSNNSEPVPYELSIATDPMIEGVTTTGSDELVYSDTLESLPLIGANEFGRRSDNFKDNPLFPDIDGTGYSAVVIDSGINVNHPAFGSDNNNDGVADRIIYQYDFADDDNDTTDLDVHGTHISSIIASEDEQHPGVAPGSNIISFKYQKDDYQTVSKAIYAPESSKEDIIKAIQEIYPNDQNIQKILDEYSEGNLPVKKCSTQEAEVFSRIVNEKTFASFSFAELALQETLKMIILNPERYNIVAVNMSIGVGGNYNDYITKDSSENTFGISDEIQALKDLGVIIVASAGNNYGKNQEQGLNYPAADPNVIPVGAVYDDYLGIKLGRCGAIDFKTYPDKIPTFSQRSGNLPMVFAPGGEITGAGLGDDKSQDNYYFTAGGTSQAAPHVTGMAILAQQLAEEELGRRLSVDEFRQLLTLTSNKITDKDDFLDDSVKNTGLTFNRVNMPNLAEAITKLERVTVEITEAEGQLDNDEFPVIGNPFGKSDFYAKIYIEDDSTETSIIENENKITPENWSFVKGTNEVEVPIKIELFDRETNLFGKVTGEEKADINKSNEKEDIELLYNTVTGNIHDESNNKNYSRGEEIVLSGDGDNQATIKFKVDGITLEQRSPKQPVTVIIHGAKDNAVQPNQDTPFNLYSSVIINNLEEKTKKVTNENNSTPYWFVPELIDKDQTEVPIEIKLARDEDLNNTNLLDINPDNNQINLNIIYNQETGEITDSLTGQVYGNRRELITLAGAENNSGEISFMIT